MFLLLLKFKISYNLSLKVLSIVTLEYGLKSFFYFSLFVRCRVRNPYFIRNNGYEFFFHTIYY